MPVRNATGGFEFSQATGANSLGGLGGFAHARTFALSIPDFKGIAPASDDSPKDTEGLARMLNLYARSFALPGAVMNPKQVVIQHGLPPINIVDSVTFAPWTVTFVDNEALEIRKYFEAWMGTIRRWENHSYATAKRYKAKKSCASILDTGNNPVHTYEFHGMFPTDISPLTVGQDNTGLIEFSVTFYYDFYKILPLNAPNCVKAVEETTSLSKLAGYGVGLVGGLLGLPAAGLVGEQLLNASNR
jgi:hypothetical protein